MTDGNSSADLAALPVSGLLDRLPGALDERGRSAINALIFELLRRDASLGRQWRTLALVLSQNGEHRSAIAAMRNYVRWGGSDPQARLEEVFTLQRAGRVVEALELLDELPETVPDRGAHAYLAGSLESMAGRLDRARKRLTDAVRLTPQSGRAWLALAMIERLDRDSASGDAIVRHDPRKTGSTMENADAYFYALGKAHADRGEHRYAFEAFSEGARLARSAQPYDPAAERRRVEQVAQGYDRAFIDRVATTVTIDTSRPIIVTGNPRSGTTLVEHILASHSAVADGGELDVMRVVGQEIGGPLEADLSHYLERSPADTLASLYLHLLDERFDEPGRIVDKRLFASRSLGVIAAILPQAPIIWMRRAPLDCAWSCFRTYFNQSSPWSHDLRTIAQHFRLEDMLLEKWQDVLGAKLLVVPYEELVEAPAVWTKRLLDHCGLAEEPGVFSPHRTDRAVMTASVAQVREPINKKGIGVAEPYREFMTPFIDAYYD